MTESYTPEEIEVAIKRICKHKEYARQHYIDNKNKIDEQQRQYDKEHKERRAEYHRRHYIDNKDEMDRQQHQYDADNKDKRAEYMRRYRLQYNLDHKDVITKYNHQHWLERPEIHQDGARKYRGLKRNAEGNFTSEEFRLLCEAFENRCVYCGQELPLVPDHATPLSRDGSNDIENIVPSCTHYNCSKGTLTYDEFVEKLKREEA